MICFAGSTDEKLKELEMNARKKLDEYFPLPSKATAPPSTNPRTPLHSDMIESRGGCQEVFAGHLQILPK